MNLRYKVLLFLIVANVNMWSLSGQIGSQELRTFDTHFDERELYTTPIDRKIVLTELDFDCTQGT